MILADAAYAATAAAGVGLTAVAVRQNRDVLGARSFAWFLGLLGVWSVVCGVGALAGVLPSPPDISEFPGIVFAPSVGVAMTTVPLLLFALQYTGRVTRPSRRLVWLFVAVLTGFVAWFVAVWIQPDGGVGTALIVGTSVAWSVSALALVAVATYVLVDAVDGVVLGWGDTAALLVPILTVNTAWRAMTFVYRAGSEPASAVAVAVPPLATLLVTVPWIGHHDLFGTLPAVGRRGRGAAIRETDDLVVVADDGGTVVEVNAAAAETLSATPGETTVPELLGDTTAALATAETVRLDGRAYDPQVSWLSDHRDRRLGAVVSLRDVTARESREQRLSVLNRVLRHNVRNQMDVVRAHAEAIDDDHGAVIRETVDTVSKLGRDARTVAQLADTEPVPVRLDEVADTVVADHCEPVSTVESGETTVAESADDESAGRVAADGSDGTVDGGGVVAGRDDGGEVTVTTDVPSATVVTDERALRVALDSAVANAVEHAASRVTVDCRARETGDGYVVAVADDGPGLPASERAALEMDRETQLEHATGLGLWKLRWAAETLGGEVSVSTDDGTTVSVTVPDRG